MNDSYDSPWKDALLDLFQPFLALLFPAVEAAIDWLCEAVALDKDLRQLAPEAELGPREADMLFQAKLPDGQPGWFYLHVGVQSQHVKDFARRMFVYHKGLEQGFRESRQTIVAILQSRFEAVPATVEERLEGVSDPGRLRELAVTAANAGSVDGFLSAFQQP